MAHRRGLTERQWFIGLLVTSGLLILFTFRGCILPTGIGPKSPPASKVSSTPAPAATAGKPGTTSEYEVQSGDTLSKIAQKFKTTAEAIAQANGITTTTTLRVGQKLKIPGQ